MSGENKAILFAIYSLGGGSIIQIMQDMRMTKGKSTGPSTRRDLFKFKKTGLADWRLEDGKKTWYLTMKGIALVEA